MDDTEDDGELARLRAWLPAQTPRTWHQVAMTWNWDAGTDILDWILDQPACDRGTAIAIYLMGEPGHYADEFASLEKMRAAKHFGVAEAEFLAGIGRRWAAGAFPTYRFHPGARGLPGDPWQVVPPGMISARAPWPVPASMAAMPLAGEAVDLSQFTEGMPNAWIEPVPDETATLLQRLQAMIRGLG